MEGDLHKLGPHRQFRFSSVGLGMGQNLVLLNTKGMLDPKQRILSLLYLKLDPNSKSRATGYP